MRRAGPPYHRNVADVQNSDIRIGDTERESALSALSEHMTAGRLDIDEYGERTARVSTAKTRGDLMAVFTDLPAPHPTFGVSTPPPRVPAEPAFQPMANPPMPTPPSIPLQQRLAASAVPIAAIIAVLLFFAVVHTWVVFLLPAAVVLFGGAIWGDGWKNRQRMIREQQRQMRREIRRRGRDW